MYVPRLYQIVLGLTRAHADLDHGRAIQGWRGHRRRFTNNDGKLHRMLFPSFETLGTA